MGLHDKVNSGGIVVVNGPGITIPGTEVGETPTNPCNIKARLQYIHYDGNSGNIGSDWKFYVNINGGYWYSGRLTLKHGDTLPVRKVIYDETIDHGCMGTPIISMGIRAREIDWGLFDDIGDIVEVTALPCEHEPNQRSILIMLPVAEYGFGVFRKLFRRYNKVARLFFLLNFETKCTTP